MDAISNAINVATANSVTVFSIVGVGSSRECILDHAENLATSTGGEYYDISDTALYDTLADELVLDIQSILHDILDIDGDGILDKCECKADFDENGVVDLADLAFLLAFYELCEGDEGYDPIANIAGCDDCINLQDLSHLLGEYGDCP